MQSGPQTGARATDEPAHRTGARHESFASLCQSNPAFLPTLCARPTPAFTMLTHATTTKSSSPRAKATKRWQITPFGKAVLEAAYSMNSTCAPAPVADEGTVVVSDITVCLASRA